MDLVDRKAVATTGTRTLTAAVITRTTGTRIRAAKYWVLGGHIIVGLLITHLGMGKKAMFS